MKSNKKELQQDNTVEMQTKALELMKLDLEVTKLKLETQNLMYEGMLKYNEVIKLSTCNSIGLVPNAVPTYYLPVNNTQQQLQDTQTEEIKEAIIVD